MAPSTITPLVAESAALQWLDTALILLLGRGESNFFLETHSVPVARDETGESVTAGPPALEGEPMADESSTP